METPDKLLYLFSADVRTKDDRYVVETPRREAETGTIGSGEAYRVALISCESNEPAESEPSAGPAPTNEPQSPVEVSKLRYIEIENIGRQGDDIARVECGYVIIVPGTEVGECVKVEITEVKSNSVVSEVVEGDLQRRSFRGSTSSAAPAMLTPPIDHGCR